VKLLLDTHVWLWANLEPARLSVAVREELVRAENDVLVSVASIWELGIKHRLGKIALEGEFSDFVRDAVEGLSVLEVRQAHAVRVHALPQHHRDPFRPAAHRAGVRGGCDAGDRRRGAWRLRGQRPADVTGGLDAIA
jgi:PIN domain nuclease of toxin-antitoxin system